MYASRADDQIREQGSHNAWETGSPNDSGDLQRAIKSTMASTVAIRTQTQLVLNQTKHVTATRSMHPQTSNAYQKFVGTAVAPTQYITSVNKDKTTVLARELQTKLSQLDRDQRMHVAAVNQALNADDAALKLLDVNDKPKDQASGWVTEKLTRVEQLSQALIRLQIDTIKDCLDNTYIECLRKSPDFDDARPVEQLKCDVQSLYTEIDDVATMFVNNEHTMRLNTSLTEIAASYTDGEQQAYSRVSNLHVVSSRYLTHL